MALLPPPSAPLFEPLAARLQTRFKEMDALCPGLLGEPPVEEASVSGVLSTTRYVGDTEALILPSRTHLFSLSFARFR
jgi:hypothetical protein